MVREFVNLQANSALTGCSYLLAISRISNTAVGDSRAWSRQYLDAVKVCTTVAGQSDITASCLFAFKIDRNVVRLQLLT